MNVRRRHTDEACLAHYGANRIGKVNFDGL
jgi:hypothetical protein